MISTLPVISNFAPEARLLQVAWQPLVTVEPAQTVYATLLQHVTTHAVSRLLLDLRQQESASLEPAQNWMARELFPSLFSQRLANMPPRVACVLSLACYQQLLTESASLVNESELLTFHYFTDYLDALVWLEQEPRGYTQKVRL